MMDTVLNLGLNDQTVEALAKKSGDRRFAFDSYRRFVQMYSDVVLGIELNHFEKHLERAKSKRGVKQDMAALRCAAPAPCILHVPLTKLPGLSCFLWIACSSCTGLRAAGRGPGEVGEVLQIRGAVGAWGRVP